MKNFSFKREREYVYMAVENRVLAGTEEYINPDEMATSVRVEAADAVPTSHAEERLAWSTEMCKDNKI